MIVYCVYCDDVFELPLSICDTFAEAKRVKNYFEKKRSVSCKIEVIEI